MIDFPELILPASDLEKTRFAFFYGADACYGGLAEHSLRKTEVNFSIKSLKQAIKLAHSLGKKFYVTFNVFPHNKNISKIKKDIKIINQFKPDAFIVSDPGIIYFIKKNFKVPIHLSTQANTTNYEAVKFWKDIGIKRIVLARELSLKEIAEIKRKVPKIELEVFVHGAMCISYSGRCLLSAVMTGREANKGNCAQPCRWKYKLFLEEEKRPGEYFPIKETEKGTYILNSKDLRLIEYLPELIKAGVSGLKIEGRNKSEYYLSIIARTYRKALNSIKSGNFKKVLPELLKETETVSHREYTTGFLFKKARIGEIYRKEKTIEHYKFLGVIKSSNNNFSKLISRNQIKKGDIIEIITPNEIFKDRIQKIFNEKGEEINVANPLPKKISIKIKLSQKYPKFSLIRKKND